MCDLLYNRMKQVTKKNSNNSRKQFHQVATAQEEKRCTRTRLWHLENMITCRHAAVPFVTCRLCHRCLKLWVFFFLTDFFFYKTTLTVLIGTGSCGTRTGGCFHPGWQCWQLLYWVGGWRCRCCPGCCCAASRDDPPPPAASPPEPAAAPTAVASEAAAVERLKVPKSLSAPPLHAAHPTAETTALQETQQGIGTFRQIRRRDWSVNRFEEREKQFGFFFKPIDIGQMFVLVYSFTSVTQAAYQSLTR